MRQEASFPLLHTGSVFCQTVIKDCWGARDGAVVRALASHQRGPGSTPGDDAVCGLSLVLVLSFAPRGFSPGTPVFPSPQKPTFSKSNSTRNQVNEEPLRGCATSKSLYVYLFIYFIIMFGGTKLWPSFPCNLLLANKRTDSITRTVPQCSSTQH